MINLGRKPITLENVRSLVSDESVWHWLLPDFKVVGRKFKSRSEGDPSSVIKYHNGALFYKDFGNIEPAYPWWKYLMIERNISFEDGLRLIVNTFNLDLGCNTKKIIETIKTPKIYPKKHYKEIPTIIRYRSREDIWKVDKEYWFDKYEITIDEMDFFKIVRAKYYWVNNGINYQFTATNNDPAYIYPIGNRRKVYKPLNKEGFKWVSNTTKDDILGMHLLEDKDINILFVESSYKDTCVMYKAGFYSLPTPSENSFLPEQLLSKIKKKNIKLITNFDNDEAGVRNAKKFQEMYNIPYIVLPETYDKNNKLIKDPSDFVENYGYRELIKIINHLTKELC